MSCEYVLGSVLAPYIEGLLAEKRVLGFSYHTEELLLARFDCYCLERGLKRPEITRDFLADWLRRSPTEGSRNHTKRVSVVRQLMVYMASIGISVYLPKELPKAEVALPHIMTADERYAFFAQLDAYRPAVNISAYHRLAGEYRVLFRMIYCCGLRNSEACGIPTSRVDLDAGTLTITDSKGRKDRLVYMADDLTWLCRDYLDWLCRTLGFWPDWFFPSKDPAKPLVNTSVDRAFNRYWNATPFAAGCGDKPVVHDLRFGFITDRVNRWALDGVDTEAMMPYLSRYVGHKDLQSTYYYIHTSEQLRDVIAKYDVIGSSAIPEEADYGQGQG
jgi:integrase